jgi:type IV pilus assembly protein PilM
MQILFNDKQAIGLEISPTDLKVMSAYNHKNQWTVSGYGMVNLDPKKLKECLSEDNGYLTESLTELLNKKFTGRLLSDQVIVGIPTSRTFSRTFQIPASAKKSLKSAVAIEVDQYIPVPISLLYVDYEVIGKYSDTFTVVMSATPKKLVDTVIASCESVGLQAVMIEPTVNSIARVLKKTEDGYLPSVIVDIGTDNTDVAILDNIVRVTAGLSVGGSTFTLDISKKLGISLEHAHQLKVLNGLAYGPKQAKITSAIKPALHSIISETRKVIRYYNERISNSQRIEQILIVGNGANVPGIADYFTNELVMPVRTANPWQELDFGKLQKPTKQMRSRYIGVAGLATVEKGAMSR